jgi:hypothetical protein
MYSDDDRLRVGGGASLTSVGKLCQRVSPLYHAGGARASKVVWIIGAVVEDAEPADDSYERSRSILRKFVSVR